MSTVRLSEIVGGGYSDFWNFKGRYLICKGSRGSKKSTTASLKIIFNMLKYPQSNAVVVRQTFNTLRDSCWKQLQWAASRLGVLDKWKFTVSPLEATYLPTGQKIYFRGLDNPLSITSITVATGYLCFCWFEEAYQITDEDTFNKIDLSLRGKLPEGYYRQIILTFNPWSEHIWIKKRFFDTPNDTNKLALTTTYKCNEWLDATDLKIFAEMKEKYPRRYLIEGQGQWGVSQGLVFDNWKVENFDADALDLPLYIGLDFGWRDPTAIIVMRVDEKNKIIYFCEEFYHSQRTLGQVAEWLRNRGYAKSPIMADAAEPRSIEELRRLGIKRIAAAKKGANSIMEGVRKLLLYQIKVHPSCENAQIELSNYSFSKDKFGEWTDKPIDDFCHLLDAARYGIQNGDRNTKIQTVNLGI